jgi:hypothetical protein
MLEDTPSWTHVTSLNNEIRQVVKSILHLPASVSSGFLYTQKKDGGLGLPRLPNLVTLACLRAGATSRIGDPLVREITSPDSFQIKLHNFVARIDCPWPSTTAEINNHKRIVKAGESDLWAQCSSQDKGVSDFRGETRWATTGSRIRDS